MTLEEIIEALRAVEDKDRFVRTKRILTNGSFSLGDPDYVTSWRGSYDQPTLAPYGGEPYQTVKDVLKLLTNAIGMEVTGWKGGQFVLKGDDTLWADAAGDYERLFYFAVDTVRSKREVFLLITKAPY